MAVGRVFKVPIESTGAPTYLSFDPGKRTGVVGWDAEGKVTSTQVLPEPDMDDFLRSVDTTNLKVIIIEEWRNYKGALKWQSNSKNETSQVIGYLKFWARLVKAEVEEQRSDIKSTAAKWAQVTIPQGHMPDYMAAYLHGYYYLHRKRIIRPSILDA